MHFKALCLSAFVALAPVVGHAQEGIAAPAHQPKKSPAERRAAIDKATAKTLAEVYKKYPKARGQIARASGYAVFHTGGIQALFLGAGAGEGVAISHGKKTYMGMIQGKVGLGLGVKDAREVWVFTTPKAYKAFVDSGWSADASAGATAKAGDTGAQVAGAVRLADDVYVYQFSENGLIAEATVAGSKYSKDDELNTKK